MVNKITASVQLVKPFQYIEETTEGTFPTTGTYLACPPVVSWSPKINGTYVDISQVGSEDLISIVQGNEVHESQLVVNLLSSTFIKYAINSQNPTSPAGTISAPLSLAFSIPVNGVENFITMTGTRAKDITLSTDIARPWTATINLLHNAIGDPTSASPFGTATIVTSLPSGVIYDWLSGGANPVSWNSSAINAKSISITINRNTTNEFTIGNKLAYGSLPHRRDIKATIRTLWTDTVMQADFRAGTARSLAAVLKSSTSTITLSNAKIKALNGRDVVNDDTNAIVEVWDVTAQTVAIT